jgi:hypothetical protein
MITIEAPCASGTVICSIEGSKAHELNTNSRGRARPPAPPPQCRPAAPRHQARECRSGAGSRLDRELSAKAQSKVSHLKKWQPNLPTSSVEADRRATQDDVVVINRVVSPDPHHMIDEGNGDALAALTFMANSNLTGCSTGRSLGFAPLKIWPRSRQRTQPDKSSRSSAAPHIIRAPRTPVSPLP